MFRVVHVATLHLECLLECLRAIERVAHPTDVAYIVFLALVNMEVYIHEILTHINHTVRVDIGIAETKFVIFLNHTLLILIKLVLNEFLGFEEALKAFLVGFLQETA